MIRLDPDSRLLFPGNWAILFFYFFIKRGYKKHKGCVSCAEDAGLDTSRRGTTVIRLKTPSTQEFQETKLAPGKNGALTGSELVQQFFPEKLKEIAALKVNGLLQDLTVPVLSDPSQGGATVELVSIFEDEGLDILRHDAAHALAEAAQELYPGIQITIGPTIENGFFYDFYRENPFTPEDLEQLEEKMREIVRRDEPISREVWTRQQAIDFYKERQEPFKVELVEAIAEDAPLSFYRQGEFIDLCRGPHLPSTGRLGFAFKLMSVAGAYWRGDHTRPQLQRIYGTAWATQEDLETHLFRLSEAEKRDHRRLGPEMGLFHFQEEAPGSAFWHPEGWVLYRAIESFIRRKIEAHNYVEVKTPLVLDKSLWEASGHWEKFGENMFTLPVEEKVFALKPMNCPCHVQIYKQGLKSYRDLPLRLAEFGHCHRNEPSGSLHGLMRVRAMVQDDGHIFCTPEQIVSETKAFCSLLKEVYATLGFTDAFVRFSDRPPVRAGSDEIWDKAEAALKEASEASDLSYVLNPGEGAFYGPKLEFVLTDSLGRKWQCGTLQVDFVLPERLDANYIGEDGQRHRPVMLHRAILGSLERFIGILIEHYGGKMPLWLMPTQVVVASITSEANPYGEELVQKLRQAGIRCTLDDRNEKIGYKIREHSLKKIPVLAVVGKKERENQQVVLRRLGSQDQETVSITDFVAQIAEEAKAP